jgi:acetylornithine/N-succinyldiaminopimelate aminotransferase
LTALHPDPPPPVNRLHEHFARHVAWTSDTPIGLAVDRAEGPFIYLKNGTRLIDFISGIAVSSLGHRHPRVVEAIHRQVDRYLHVMVYGEFIQQPQVEFASLLASRLPDALQVVYFTMTGTEANEGALKLAKKATGRSKMIAFDRSYHGDTHGSLSVTGREVYRTPFLPLLPDVEFLPFDDIAALDAIDERTACVITEPIQGEGGIRVPSDAWMRRLRERCTDTGALLIFDEIQSGFGRTGTLFAFEGFGVVPDILTIAKAAGGGMPLGAFISSASTLDTLRREPPLSHVTTFGGHPVSAAAAHAALQVLLEERLADRARTIGEEVRRRLDHPLVREVRGRGAMLGMELTDRDVTARVVASCLKRGVLLGWTLHSDTLVRLAPPLNIPDEVLSEALGIIFDSLDEERGG